MPSKAATRRARLITSYSTLKEVVLETTLGQAALKGHLAAFKARAFTAAATGKLALHALAGRLAVAGANTRPTRLRFSLEPGTILIREVSIQRTSFYLRFLLL